MHFIRIKYIVIYLGALLISVNGCRRSSLTYERQGEIIYSITYIENDLQKFSTDLMPKKLVVHFKNDNTEMVIDGFFGLFNVSNVVNVRKKINITYLSVLDKKFYYEGDFNEPAAGFGSIPKLTVRQGAHTKEICGYLAKEAYITLPGSKVPFPIYYTSDIPVHEPNRATPYKNINGVLLEFYLHVSRLKMKLTATGIYFKDIDDRYFSRRKDYIRVSRKQLEDILNKLME